ncbi:TetR/AcrR family transcriptional regulator [Antribacter gilvus]|uniref:TetR/AcrR family transcriptional regulator n=1 Tax=Antribacter gilvus TaxID=2304675 RepID=UPI000F783427|nr:TetR/AcrR family transcriptional regulator [Antribacter gilvus]
MTLPVPADAPDPDDVGLRERKKRARRALLVDTAQRLVADHGLDAVTVELIGAEAGVSTRTFFNYFESKDDAVLGVEDSGIDPAVAQAFSAGGPSGLLLTDLQVLVAALLQRFAANRERTVRALRLMEAEPRLLQRHLVWMDRHKSELHALFDGRRPVAPFSADNELLTMLVLTLVRTAITAWERSGYHGDVDAHLSEAVAQLIHVVASDIAPSGVGPSDATSAERFHA